MKKTKVYHITFHEFNELAYLFFLGCNFICKGCIRKVEPFDCSLKDRNKKIHFIEIKEIINLLKPFKPKIALFGGWEPTTDPSLPEIASGLHSGLGTWNYLLTNGYKLVNMKDIDEVKVSIKAYSDQKHLDYTGKSNFKVLENFKKIYKSGIKLSAETVLIPGYINLEEIVKIARFISSVDKNIPLRIDAYWPKAFKKWRRPAEDEIKKAIDESKKYLNKISSLIGKEKIKGKIIKIF